MAERKRSTKGAHTPGPWEIGEHVESPNRRMIEPGIAVLLGLGGTPDANGRLIAAAPRMYDFVLSFIDGRASLSDADDIRRAVEGA
jgi:hypothetical protein